MLLCISWSLGEFSMRLYIVLHNATKRSSDMVGKQIVECCQLVILLSVFKSFKFDSKINKHILNTNNTYIYKIIY